MHEVNKQIFFLALQRITYKHSQSTENDVDNFTSEKNKRRHSVKVNSQTSLASLLPFLSCSRNPCLYSYTM